MIKYIKKLFAKKQKEAILESKTGYTCPNCGAMCSDNSLILREQPEFREEPDPNYYWDEQHKCTKCETVYIIHNST